MTPISALLIALAVAAVVVVVLERYFVYQAKRRWLGMSYTMTDWDSLFDLFEFKFAYRRQDVEEKLISAGIYDSRWAAFYFPVKIGVGSMLMVLVFLFGEQFGFIELAQQLTIAMIAMVTVIILPDFWLQLRKAKRIRQVSAQLPYLIDLVAVCIQTGMTIESAFEYISDELSRMDKDLSYAIKRLVSLSKVSSLEKALNEFLEQFPTSQVRSFVYTLNQSLQYGSSIYSVLNTLSASIREIEMLELEEKVGKLSAKMSVPLILFIMLPIVILIVAPGIMRMMA